MLKRSHSKAYPRCKTSFESEKTNELFHTHEDIYCSHNLSTPAHVRISQLEVWVNSKNSKNDCKLKQQTASQQIKEAKPRLKRNWIKLVVRCMHATKLGFFFNEELIFPSNLHFSYRTVQILHTHSLQNLKLKF